MEGCNGVICWNSILLLLHYYFITLHFTLCNYTSSDTTHTLFPKDIHIASLRVHLGGGFKLIPYALSWNLETTIPFQDRTVCKGITKAPLIYTLSFLMYLSWIKPFICREFNWTGKGNWICIFNGSFRICKIKKARLWRQGPIVPKLCPSRSKVNKHFQTKPKTSSEMRVNSIGIGLVAVWLTLF